MKLDLYVAPMCLWVRLDAAFKPKSIYLSALSKENTRYFFKTLKRREVESRNPTEVEKCSALSALNRSES